MLTTAELQKIQAIAIRYQIECTIDLKGTYLEALEALLHRVYLSEGTIPDDTIAKIENEIINEVMSHTQYTTMH